MFEWLQSGLRGQNDNGKIKDELNPQVSQTDGNKTGVKGTLIDTNVGVIFFTIYYKVTTLFRNKTFEYDCPILTVASYAYVETRALRCTIHYV